MSRNLGGFHSQEDGVFVSLSFFMVVLTSCCFDWDFLVNGICYLRCKWDILIYRWCFGLFYLLLISGVRDICKITALQWRNLELGLQVCCRGLICICESSLWGGDIMHISPVRRCFSPLQRQFQLCKIEIFILVCCWRRQLLCCVFTFYNLS